MCDHSLLTTLGLRPVNNIPAIPTLGQIAKNELCNIYKKHYPPKLRNLAIDAISSNVTLLYDYILGLGCYIGYTHDVGYRLIEVKENSMETEEHDKLMDIFIHCINHTNKEDGIELLLSPHTLLLKDKYLTRFLKVHGARVSKVTMTDSHLKPHPHPFRQSIDSNMIQYIIMMLASNQNTVNLTELKLMQWSNSNESGSNVTNLKWLYVSHLSHSLTVLRLCCVNFSACDILDVRHCMASLINLRELRLVKAEFDLYESQDKHRHQFTLPIHVPEVLISANHDNCVCRNTEKCVHDTQAPDIPRKLEVLVFTERKRMSRPNICTNPSCPQIQELDSFFIHYPNVRVLDLTNVHLNTNSLKSIISNVKLKHNDKKLEKLVITPISSEQIEIFDKYKREKEKEEEEKEEEEGRKKEKCYDELVKYVEFSNCAYCLITNGKLRILARLIVEEVKLERLNAGLNLMMSYAMRHCTNFHVIYHVLLSVKNIIYESKYFLYTNVVPSIHTVKVWLSHIWCVLQYCNYPHHKRGEIQELMLDICTHKIINKGNYLQRHFIPVLYRKGGRLRIFHLGMYKRSAGNQENSF